MIDAKKDLVLQEKPPSRFTQWLKNIRERKPASQQQVPEVVSASNSGATEKIQRIQRALEQEFEQKELMQGRDDSIMVEKPKVEDDYPTEPQVSDEAITELNNPEPIKNIAATLEEKLRDIERPGELKISGQLAISGTNETAPDLFFNTVQAKQPDGYLVGVGVGNALTMLHCFSRGIVPKGIVLADVDPRVVAAGKSLVRALKMSRNIKEFKELFLEDPEMFGIFVGAMINGEKDPVLKERLKKISKEAWDRVASNINYDYKGSQKSYSKWDPKGRRTIEGQKIDVIGAIFEKFNVLKRLADEGNIAISYADFTNPQYIDAVRQLPEFDSSENIIYSSNIVDHISKRGWEPQNAIVMQNLKAYESAARKPIFIDTTGTGLNYFLRATRSVPEYLPQDLPRESKFRKNSEKPDGLLFADEKQAA